MRGRIRSPAPAGHSPAPTIALSTEERRLSPSTPGSLVGTAVEPAWNALWQSDLALALTETDLGSLTRYFELQLERRKVDEAIAESGLLIESGSGPKPNPLLVHRAKLDVALERAEDRLGLNPRGRLQLGLQALEARERVLESADGATDTAAEYEEDDPREDES